MRTDRKTHHLTTDEGMQMSSMPYSATKARTKPVIRRKSPKARSGLKAQTVKQRIRNEIEEHR